MSMVGPESCLHVGIWQHVYSLLPFCYHCYHLGAAQNTETTDIYHKFFFCHHLYLFIHSFSKYLVSTCSLQGHGSLGICGWIGDAPYIKEFLEEEQLINQKEMELRVASLVLKTAKQAE